MSTPAGGLTGILGQLGNATIQAAGYAGGRAVAPILAPELQVILNEAWAAAVSLGATIPPEVYVLAQGVAQGQVDETTARGWSHEQGFADDAFSALIDIANAGPPLAAALTLLRRGFWLPDQYKTALNRMAIEKEWYEGLLTLQDEWLSPAELAVMIQRSVIPNPGILPNQPSLDGSNVPQMPVVEIPVLKEAAGSGVNEDRLKALTRIIGLPAPPDLAARMHFRNIITEGAFNQAILEGNTRGEWAPFLLDGFRQIPTAHDGIEARLRGWTDDKGMYAQTARHGMSTDDTDLLFKVTGRPLSFHQVFIGERRGGIYDGPTTGIDPAFLKSLQESNIRPEWYNIAWAQRYTYPSAFVLRALTQGGDLTQAETHTILLDIGWEPTLATKVSAKWAGGTGSTADPLVKSARASLITALHKAYVLGDEDAASAQAILTAEGVAQATQTELLATWDRERSITRKELTPAQLKKAYTQGTVNPATGSAFTQDEAIAELVTRGYSSADAKVFLTT
jgi:hypothetical protein